VPRSFKQLPKMVHSQSRQRSRVRVSSSTPFFSKDLAPLLKEWRGTQEGAQSVTAEVASSSLVVHAILFKGLSSAFERMAWYTRRCTLSDPFCGHSLVPFLQDHFHNFRLCPPLLASDGTRVDVHGEIPAAMSFEWATICQKCCGGGWHFYK